MSFQPDKRHTRKPATQLSLKKVSPDRGLLFRFSNWGQDKKILWWWIDAKEINVRFCRLTSFERMSAIFLGRIIRSSFKLNNAGRFHAIRGNPWHAVKQRAVKWGTLKEKMILRNTNNQDRVFLRQASRSDMLHVKWNHQGIYCEVTPKTRRHLEKYYSKILSIF